MVLYYLQIGSLDTHPFSIRLAYSIHAQVILLRDMQADKVDILDYTLIPAKMKRWLFQA